MDTAGNTAIGARRAPTQIAPRQEVQLRRSLIATLAGLAEARQAGVSQETLELYAECLSDFPVADVRQVARTLAMQKRQEGETAFPALGDLIEPLKALRRRRMDEQREARQRKEEIEHFWLYVAERVAAGENEAEILERFPSYEGTKPE